MKITSNNENKLRYCAEIYNDDYFYKVYVTINEIKAAIVITTDGVSVDILEGESKNSVIHTNIVPQKLFPQCKELNRNQLEKIVKIVENTGCEGKLYSPKDIKFTYNKWKNEVLKQ